MSVNQKREEVLEKIYDRLLETDGLDEFFNEGQFAYTVDGKRISKQHPSVQLIAALENARKDDTDLEKKETELQLKMSELQLKETELQMKARDFDIKDAELELKQKEFDLKDNQVLVDNAARDMDRRDHLKMEILKVLGTASVSLITTIMWGALFTHELRATRAFELEGTEVSAAGRWLKNSFPKPRV